MEPASPPSAAPNPAAKRANILFGVSASLVVIHLASAILLPQEGLVPVAWFVPAVLALYFAAALSIALLSFGRFLFRKEPYAFWVGLAFWISSLFQLAHLFCLETPADAPDVDAAYFFYLSHLALLLPTFHLLAQTKAPKLSSWRALAARLAWLSLGCIALAGAIFLMEDRLPPLWLSARAGLLSAFLLLLFSLLYAGAAWIQWRRFRETHDPLLGYVGAFLLLGVGVFFGLALSRQPSDFAWFSSHLLPIVGCLFLYLALLLEYLDLYRELDASVEESQRHAEIQRLLKEVMQDITTLDVDQLVQKLTSKVCAVLKVDVSDVRLAIGGAWQSVGVSGIDPGRLQSAATGSGLRRSRIVIESRKPMVVEDMSLEGPSRWDHRSAVLGFRGYVGVPLCARSGEVIGVLRVLNYQPRHFRQDEVDLLQQLAGGAAVAIESARLFEDVNAKSRDLEAINLRLDRLLQEQSAMREVFSQINLLDLPQMLRQLTEHALVLLRVDQIRVALLKDGGKLRTVSTLGDTGERRLDRERHTGQGRSGWVLKNQKPLVIKDMSRDPSFAGGRLAEDMGMKGYLGIPLLSRQKQSIGVLAAATRTEREFTSEEIAVAQQFAAGAAIAIENAYLLEEARQKSLHLEALIKVNRDVASLLKKEFLLPSIANEARKFLNVDGASFRMVEGRMLVRAAFAGAEELLALTPVMALGESVTGKIVRENRVIAIKNVRHDPVMVEKHRKILSESGYPTFLGVPLRLGSHVIGTINLYSKQEREFRPDEIQMITAFADQTAIAVQNARLYEELQMKSGELEDAFRTKTDFLNTMAHELRTPLNVVIGTQQLLLDGSYGAVSDEQGKALERIGRYAQDLLSLINEILDLVRLDARKVPVRASEFSVRDVTDDLELSFAPLAREKGLALKFAIDDGMPSVRSDRSKIREILQNLLANAVKYTEKGEVELAVSMRNGSKGDRIVWSVRDTGIGIDRSDVPHLFEPFYMADGVDRRKYPGTGLGLSIVKRLIELLEGDIEIDSELGKGSTFTVSFPSVDLQ